MTCIVGYKDNGKVYIGGDSAGVGGYDIQTRLDKKVFVNGEFVMGFTTSFRMGQLLHYKLKVPERFPSMDVMEYMVTIFIDAVRQCLKDGGYAHKEAEVEQGGVFLVGYQGRLFRIDNDYQVGEVLEGYDSCGCGEAYALGALAALSKSDLEVEYAIIVALETAAKFSAGVRGPFNIVSN